MTDNPESFNLNHTISVSYIAKYRVFSPNVFRNHQEMRSGASEGRSRIGMKLLYLLALAPNVISRLFLKTLGGNVVWRTSSVRDTILLLDTKISCGNHHLWQSTFLSMN